MRAFFGLLALCVAEAGAAFELYGNSFGIPGVNASYDYVVVGGGNAGLTIAARLAEDERVSVAVVEAGSFYQIDNGNGSVIPSLATTQFVGTDPNDTQPLIDWNFVTVPQAGAGGRRIPYARGKTLGGSSARNYMAYHRGTSGSYQRWADEVGDQSYTFPNLLPYFQRSVHLTPPKSSIRFANASVSYDALAFNNSVGFHQPLQVSWPNWALPIATWAQNAMEAIGISTSAKGFENGSLNGVSWVPATVDPVNGHRSSSQTSFLDYAMHSTSIKVYSQALARQITFTSNRTANGVHVQSGNTNFTLTATKEVILSAGAFQSPQLLMVSGIGPKETLEQYDIPVIADLAGVGQNLWDQPLYGIVYRVNVETGSMLINDPVYAAEAATQYLVNATGPLTGPPGLLAFERISQSQPDLLANETIAALKAFPSDWPEVEYLVENGYSGLNRNYRLDEPSDGYNYATISAALITPFSRGNVTISSADASVPPVINPNWLTTSEDKDIAVASFKRVREIWAQMSGVTLGPEYLPGPNVTTDEQILNFIQQDVVQFWHASATCKMGKRNDTMAVIDSHARVYGVNGLRVVDASSFPFLTPGHPQSGVYMLAEKIADDVKSGR
ncbi:hypothetical protein LTR36_001319 [Oleoguttula mirabilis]|uniref:Glucose-methanol-choline oxidoreductase N-terminal domain-containing protein n=1 Tax=Oleoguttula mirabilis TaxID=1507867 RepID=A0AAV9JNH0_9PEZI|nr:hypothetical protein LTR36_001319 [Oleoguttula mirabilis]